jgi:hypothetical protein
MFATARLLRGKASLTQTLTVTGFAHLGYLFELFGFLPVIGSIARGVAVLFTFFSVWLGVAAVHEVKGWRTLLLPVVYLIIIVVAVVFITAALRGTAFALDALLEDFGWTPE